MILSDAAGIVDFLQNRIRGHWPEPVVVEWIRALETIDYPIGNEAARQLANDWTSEFPPPWGKMVEYLRAADRRATERQLETMRGREITGAPSVSLPEHLDWLHAKIARERQFGDLDEMKVWQRRAVLQPAHLAPRSDEARPVSLISPTELVEWFASRQLLDEDLAEFYGMEAR